MTFQENEADYAFWSSPAQSFTITYSLDQFQEIDFLVSEGFRRIPHGGIETGGLLFGRREPSGIRIQAFRQIVCEHATGPSFTLSDRDLQELRKQIAASRTDGDLAGMDVLGWYVAHTRTPFQLTDREAAISDEFFPAPHQITVLVKPERFQATKFGFLLRKPDGRMERDPGANAIILPLPGRSSRTSDGPVASIPAPAQKPTPILLEESKTKTAPASAVPEEQSASAVIDVSPERMPTPTPPPDASKRHGVTRPRAAAGASVEEAALTTAAAEPPESDVSANSAPLSKPHTLPSIDEIKSRRSGRSTPEQAVPAVSSGRAYAFQLVLILVLAALLGSAAGYWAYLQLPAQVIPLAVHPEANNVVITWPTDQTRQAVYAGIRVNDGAQQPLTTEEKRAGAVRVPASAGSSVKVELIVQHWLRDSRGIVRYVAAAPQSGVASIGHMFR